MGGRTTPIVSIFFYFKNHKKSWKLILLHQSVDRGLEKLYAISFGQLLILRRFFGLFFEIFLLTWVTRILLILEGWFLLSFVPHIDSEKPIQLLFDTIFCFHFI